MPRQVHERNARGPGEMSLLRECFRTVAGYPALSMKMRISARARKHRRRLTEAGIARILRRTLPRRNGYVTPNTAELLKEAIDFGITNELQFRRLLLKHRRALLVDDREYLHSRPFLAAAAEDYGDAHVQDMKRRQYCFSWEGLTRNAFELEFGQAYEDYAQKRDGLNTAVTAGSSDSPKHDRS
jgi:hypothetical protein